MAETAKKPESKTPAHEPKDKKSEAKPSHAPVQATGKDKKSDAPHTPKPSAPKPAEKKTGAEKKAAEAAKRAETKKGVSKKPTEKDDVKIVEKASQEKHVARAKPTLTAEQKEGLAQRRTISNRRPWFRRTQWYEYKRLANSGWRKPMGIDSAMRRHFGYEQSVVRVGFGGPASVRGLHPSGFREVYVTQPQDLKAIDPKTQAARINGHLGTRKLKIIYAEADKLGVRVLNRRTLQ
jgi:large subunit ribosomal protein L32e